MKEKDDDRIAYIDIARAFAIFLVVLGHTLTEGKIRSTIYSFHMPLFFLISGMTLRQKDLYRGKEFVKIIRKRFISYYIPYLIWGLFYSTLNFSNLLKLLWGSRRMLIKIKSLSSLWFLPVLLVADILSESIMRIQSGKKNFRIILAAAVLFFIIGFKMPQYKPYGWPLGLNIGFVAAGFMLTGYLSKNIIPKLYTTTERAVIITIGLLLILAFNLVFECFPIGTVSMYKGRYGNIVIFLVNAILESVVVVSIAICFEKMLPETSMLEYIGKNTLGIMVIHKPIVRFLSSIAIDRGYSNNIIWVAVVITLAGGVFSLLITGIIVRLAPVLVGRSL